MMKNLETLKTNLQKAKLHDSVWKNYKSNEKPSYIKN